MSFFDEADEPRTTTRTTPSRRRSSGGRRPPDDRQAIQIRRAVALGALAVLAILIVLGVQSCESSQRTSALKDYNNNVAALIQSSNQTGSQVFGLLSGAQGSNNTASLQHQLGQARMDADTQLSKAQKLSVPSQVQGAQEDLLLTLQMRRDGIANIEQQIAPAFATGTSQDAVNHIAREMARFYASDVVYKSYVLTQLAGALNSAGISGEQMNGGQFVPDIRWLTPSFVTSQLNAASGTSSNVKPAPGVHGHRMDSCSVGGSALNTGSTNTIPASPPPVLTCLFTNDGQNQETNVTVKVSVSGTSISAQTVVPQTTPGQQSTAQVTLPSSPPAGTYNVSATVERVPGETATTHNTLVFPVSFQ